ncbi:hypothetical protein B0I37DRAFT_123751 [Chaetomium sp. MPI-CAGE-AT-0009]|nr:hypothetical protein B0I37DRAFT_123751 [Chaetomium sp. MPI-CAGE-AT-0009]
MFGSYSSSSSSSSSFDSFTSRSPYSMSSPMDIAPRSSSSRRGPDPECAFPSWPRRSSLGEGESEERATSYITDDELFMDVFEDDACSVSSSQTSPAHSPAAPVLTEAEFLQLQREQLAYQREMRKIALAEKEMRRRQAEQDQQRRRPGLKRRSTSGKKAPKTKLSAMTTITEAE